MARVIARILADTSIEGVGYKVNQVVAFEKEHAERLQESGAIDTDPAAVKYCEDELAAESIDHEKAAEPEEKPAKPAAGMTSAPGAKHAKTKK